MSISDLIKRNKRLAETNSALLHQILGKPHFVWRTPEPTSADYTQATLTEDDAFHELDISGIVPANTTAIAVSLIVSDGSVGARGRLRSSSQSSFYQALEIQVNVANKTITNNGIVGVSGQAIDYAFNVVFTYISITILGWYV